MRNEECLTSAGLKSIGIHTNVIMHIIDIKQITNIIRGTFVMMLNSFLASSRDDVPCVRYAKTSLRLLDRPSAFSYNWERCSSELPHTEVSAAGCPSGI